MYLILSIIVVGVVAVSLVITLSVGKDVDKTIEALKEIQDEDEQAAMLKAKHFKNHRTNIRVLTLIYVLTFIITIVALIWYLALK